MSPDRPSHGMPGTCAAPHYPSKQIPVFLRSLYFVSSETISTENVGVIVSFSVARRQGQRSFSIRAAT
jgi:hypothetical protein